MNKMIAIVNEPKDCLSCSLFCARGISFKCCLSNRWISSIYLTKRPDWCKLKEVPEKIEVFKDDWSDGYNACLEEILE